ncbi:MAG: hydantoinase/oxoprolinase family protein [Acidimicrobiia bacterium]|nr:hydantoinase/oxoprolinase family protein [Acidimicrobiia bacterium]NNL26894.1 hydantoinase/oxoprolinase family protein [Acidimicrobiia bacterium]
MLGIDTGGTYTDAVLFDHETGQVVAKAKGRTRPDLKIGIGEVLDAIIQNPEVVSLVSLSTTLATNAIVEGVGGRIALVFIGFDAKDGENAGLVKALAGDRLITIGGGHDPFGNEASELDLAALEAELKDLDVDACAVTAKFSVRNPEHEIAVRELMEERGIPVTCGHELSSRLNGPKRALTCVLNARLLGMVRELSEATRVMLSERDIDAPLMLVRGDGSLVSEAFARHRPIETILSGPAASLIGASFLTGVPDAVVSDIGGTTTDIAILQGGTPTISLDGASVGGHKTMVEAVEMYTHGLGGDSEVVVNDRSEETKLILGPRRVVPVCLLAHEHPDLVHSTLDAWQYPVKRYDGRFIGPTGRQSSTTLREQAFLDRIGDGWVPAGSVISSSVDGHTARSLVSRGLAAFSAYTPTDAAHALGIQTDWDADAAKKVSWLMANSDTGKGTQVSLNGEEFARLTIDTLVRRSAEKLLDAALAHDRLSSTSESPLVQDALNRHRGVTRIDVGLDLPVVGLGASAPVYYTDVAEQAGSHAIIPEHAGVANAIGAVVGQVRITRRAIISQPSKGKFRVHLTESDRDFGDKQPAIDFATHALIGLAERDASQAGALEVTTISAFEERSATVGNKEVFVEGLVTVISSGRPRLATR